MSDKLFSDLFYFQHKDGSHLYPCKMKNRDTGKLAFRVSVGGTKGNTKENGEEIDCELKVKELVLNHGYAVRAKTKDKKKSGLYKVGQRSIISAVIK